MNLNNICGMTFAPFVKEGSFAQERAKTSLKLMKERTNANLVILVPNGLQETPQSEEICYTSQANVNDEELKEMIAYAQEIGLLVALKPTVNCKNGTWRAHVNFFDEDVPCEPKWCNWFDAYAEFQSHYAKISQELGCVMHIAGCEMVQSERREAEWRRIIADIRRDYRGLVSYNTDKYQEHNVKWWDAVDVISSSGYYPITDYDAQLDRIEKVVRQFDKPFFFAEAGCMSVEGSKNVPNDWTVRGGIDLEGQAQWFETMFETCMKRDWVSGWAIWSWTDRLYSLNQAATKGDYEIYGKPAEEVVSKYYAMLQSRTQMKSDR